MELTFTEPQTKQFYTKHSHEEFCRLCDKDNIPEDKRLAIAEEMGIGFGYKYMYELENALHSYDVLSVLEKADGRHSDKRYDTALNTAANYVCSKLTRTMSDYILQRNGLIDIWPSPEYADAFTVYLKNKHHERYYDEYEEDWVVKDSEEIAAEVTLPYCHFIDEYTQHVTTTSSTEGSDKVTDVLNKQSVWEIKPKDTLTVSTFHYCPEERNEEFKTLSDKKYQLEQKYKFAKGEKKQTDTNFFKKCIIAAPTVVTILVALLSVLWTFTGAEELEDAVNTGFFLSWLNQASQGEGLLKIITIVPAVFVKIAAVLWYLVALIGSLFGIEKITVIIAMLLLMAGGFMVSMMIDGSIHSSTDATISKKEWREARKAKREAEKIDNNPRFKALQKAYNDKVAKYMDFSKRWQEAWLNAYRE